MSLRAVRLTLAASPDGSVDLRLAPCRRRAWVTLLSTDSYLRGVQCLARALRAVRSRYELVVMVTGTVGEASMRALRAEACTTRVMEYVRVPSESRAAYACAHFADCWTKLSAWGWVEFEQLAYLDADMLPLRNLDELLDADVPAGVLLLAVPECACRQRAMRAHCPYAGSAAAEPGAERLVRRYFNAGLLVFRPSLAEHAALLRGLASADAAALPFAEQDYLNQRYSAKWRPLSAHYNATKALLMHHRAAQPQPPQPPHGNGAVASGMPPFHLDLRCVRNLHFTMAKPWQLRDPLNKGFGKINQLWWDHFLKGAPDGGAARGVATLNKVCMVLAVRARATRAAAEPSRDGPRLAGLSSSDDSDSDAEAAPDAPAEAVVASADALAEQVVESERWCLVLDEPAGHLRVQELRRELSDSERELGAAADYT